jgi:peptidoglycan hydrolase CwlO-like protein
MDNTKNIEKQLAELKKEADQLKKFVQLLSVRLQNTEKQNRRLTVAAERAQNQINALKNTLSRRTNTGE